MQYDQLGRSALRVSRICLGTMNFGPRCSEQESFDILDVAVNSGINFIDTANQYGGELGVGTSETIIGRWLSQDPSRRDNLVIATKVHEPMSEDINDRGLSARHIQMACDASLKRLGIDHIDLYQMHHIDRSVRPEEIWQAMDRLIAQGKITYVGSSNFPGWAIAQLNERAGSGLGLVSEQGLYNLIERRAEMEVIPACREYGLGLIPWSPLAGGLLAGKPTASGRRSAMASAFETRADQLSAFESLCQELGETPGAIALAWLLHNPQVTSTIVGPGNREQLESILHVPDIELDTKTLRRLDDIFPAVGETPEAYAW